MNRSILISRDLPESSLLRRNLIKAGWKVITQSLISIHPMEFSIGKEDFDWLFLSSANGADILFGSYSPKKSMRIAVAGEATAKAVRKQGLKSDFIGRTGDMDAVGKEFASAVGDDMVLFAGAENSSMKIRSALSANQVRYVPIYRTVPEDGITIPRTDAVFLTSPSNAEAYLKAASLKGRTVIAIGQTTAEYLKECGIGNILIPKTPKEKDVLALLLRL